MKQRGIHIILLLSLSFFAGISSAATDGKKPNILFILADDMGWRDCGAYGSRYYETPNLDRLASESLRFTEACSASPVCSPTRASILTGQYPGRIRLTQPYCHVPQAILDPKVPRTDSFFKPLCEPQTRTRFPLSYETLPEVLKEAGYTTCLVGKWHLGAGKYAPEHQGFDTVIGGTNFATPPPKGAYFYPWNFGGFKNTKPGDHICDVITREAVNYLHENRNSPFFMCLWYYSVHGPFMAKEDVLERFRGKKDPLGNQHCPEMAAMLYTLDENVGKVLAELKQSGLDKNTIVIFTSDNGGAMYQDVNGVPPTSNAPLRNGKGSNYEGGVRVPLMVRWPGVTQPGTVSDALVSSVDYFPTLLDGLGLALRPDLHIDGVSFLNALKGADYNRSPIISHLPHSVPATGNIPNISIRDGYFKLYRFFENGPGLSDRFELYNLKSDIGEQHNIADQYPEKVASLNRLLDKTIADAEMLCPKPNPNYVPGIKNWADSSGDKVMFSDGIIQINAVSKTPFIETRDFPALKTPLTLQFEIKSRGGRSGTLSWTDRAGQFFKKDSVGFDVNNDGEWHVCHVDIVAEKDVVQLKLQPEGGGIIQFRNVVLLDKDKTPAVAFPAE